MRSFLLYAVYDGRLGVAVAGFGGGGAAVVSIGIRSNKLEAAALGGACGGADGAGESKRPRISAAVVF